MREKGRVAILTPLTYPVVQFAEELVVAECGTSVVVLGKESVRGEGNRGVGRLRYIDSRQN
jgi:hypothetical protein